MAAYALVSEYLALNGTDRSSYVKSAVLTVDAEALDSTTMGDDGWKAVTGGMKGGQLAITFVDSATDNEIDEILWGIWATTVTFEVRATDASVSDNNAKYTGNVFIAQHSIGGAVGELATKQLTFPTSGTVTRAVA